MLQVGDFLRDEELPIEEAAHAVCDFCDMLLADPDPGALSLPRALRTKTPLWQCPSEAARSSEWLAADLNLNPSFFPPPPPPLVLIGHTASLTPY